MPAILSDHMVLRKSAKTRIWGKADPGEKVVVTLERQTVEATAGQDRTWSLFLNLKDSAPGPFKLLVQGKNKIVISDVVVGEVWVASGQSNMQWQVKYTRDADKEIASSTNSRLRVFRVETKACLDPAEDVQGSWMLAGPEGTASFTAIGYYYAKALQRELHVPVGIISTAVGGVRCAAWVSGDALDTVPAFRTEKDTLQGKLKDYLSKKEAYLTAFNEWLKKNGREDKGSADTSEYAAENAPADGWTKVNMPGKIVGAGLPSAGIFWLRKVINLAAKDAHSPRNVLVGPLNTSFRVYWNGHPVEVDSFNNYFLPNTGFGVTLAIPGSLTKEGRNVLALRFFSPLEAPSMGWGPSIYEGESLVGDWLAKAEATMPELDAATKATAPAIPKPEDAVGFHEDTPGCLFNGMIHPIVPYTITGVIWYQGETDVWRSHQYLQMFSLMITDWRAHWNQGNFPFYYCQLTNYQAKTPTGMMWADLRDLQTQTLKVPNTTQAVLIDIGEAGNIHPRNKLEVGERLAKIALAKNYGKKIPCSGPVYERCVVAGEKIRVTFTETTDGLVAKLLPKTYMVNGQSGETAPLVRHSPQSALEGFEICGADLKWQWADAMIEGNSVIVSSKNVPKPLAVRYAWADFTICNLFNGVGLPAGPFCSVGKPN